MIYRAVATHNRGNQMKIVLTREEVENLILVRANVLVPDAKFNRIEWAGYRTPGDVTIEHTDVPQEKEDE